MHYYTLILLSIIVGLLVCFYYYLLLRVEVEILAKKLSLAKKICLKLSLGKIVGVNERYKSKKIFIFILIFIL